MQNQKIRKHTLTMPMVLDFRADIIVVADDFEDLKEFMKGTTTYLDLKGLIVNIEKCTILSHEQQWQLIKEMLLT